MSLTLDGVSVAFAGVRALTDVTLSVEPGSVVAVCGPNGAGKTTVVNLASGVIAADSGRIEVDGRDLTSPRDHARAGVVRTFQSVRLFESMSALDNVLVGAARGARLPLVSALVRTPAFRRRERELRHAALVALADLGVAPLAHRTVAALSHGQRRRVELARAVAARPAYLVLDEPGAGVDPGTVEVLAALIRSQAGAGVGVLLVEHDSALLERVSDGAVALVGGRVVAVGTYGEVSRQVDIAAQLDAAG